MRRLNLPRWVGAALAIALVACQPSVAKLRLEASSDHLVSRQRDVAWLAVTALDGHGQVVRGARVHFESSDSSVLAIDERTAIRRPDGAVLVHPVVGQSGVATVSVHAGKVSAERQVEVSLPQSLSVNPSAVRLAAVGQTSALQIRVRDERGQVVKDPPVWFRLSGDPDARGLSGSVVVVEPTDGGCALRAVSPGKVGLLISSGPLGAPTVFQDPVGSFSVPVAIQVGAGTLAHPAPTAAATPQLVIAPVTGSLKVGQTLGLRATLGPGLAPTRTRWRSGSPKVLSVDSRGRVKARRRGTAEVVVTAGRLTAKITIQVR